MIYYTADNHFGHGNIIKHCNRPFKDSEEMDIVQVNKWNSYVTNDDIVYILGDFAFNRKNFMEIIPQLNGLLIFLPGNHDIKVVNKLAHQYSEYAHIRKDLKAKCTFLERDIIWVKDSMPDSPEEFYIVLCHYPLLTWNRKYHGAIHLYGHEHGKLGKYDTHAFDVGVDCWDFAPVTLEQIIMKEWQQGTLYEKDNN